MIDVAGGFRGMPLLPIRRRSPRWQRPWLRVMLVAVQVSSMKSSRSGSRSSWSWNQASRALRMSGRSCSAACPIFMDGPPPPTIGAGWRRIRGEDYDQDAYSRAGIDLGKNSCSLAGLAASGAVVLRRPMARAFVAKLPMCVVTVEACCGAHFLGRTF